MNRARLLAGAALAACAGLWIAHVAAALRYPLGSDPSIFQYYAWLMDIGITPYRDVLDVNTPGVILLHWAWAQVAGLSDAALIGLALGLSTLCLGGAAWSLRRRVTPLALLVGITAGLWAFAAITPWDRGQRELFQGALLLGACALGGRAARQDRGGVAMLLTAATGVVAGAAVTIKVTTAVVVWAMWAAWLVQLQTSRPRRGEGITRAIGGAAFSFVGFLVPLGAVLAWLAANDALAAWWTIQTTFLALHGQQMVVGFGELMTRGALPLTVLGVGLGALVASRGAGDDRHALRALGAGLLANLAAYLLQRHGWTYHLHVSVPLMLPAVALIAQRLAAVRWARAVAITAAALLLLRVGAMVAYDHTAGLERAWQVGDHWSYEAMQEVAALIEAEAGPEPHQERVLTNDDEQQLLLMARRPPATPFVYGFMVSEAHEEPVLHDLALRRVDIVHREPPRWVVWNTRPYKPAFDSLDANPTLAIWLESSCQERPQIPPYRIWRCDAPR